MQKKAGDLPFQAIVIILFIVLTLLALIFIIYQWNTAEGELLDYFWKIFQ